MDKFNCSLDTVEEIISDLEDGSEDSIQNTVLRHEGKRQKVTERRLIRKEEDEGGSSIWRVNN